VKKLGRPEEYKEDYISKVDEYLSSRQDQEYEFHKTRGDKSDSFEEKIKVKLPTVEGFALFIGVNKTSLYEWEKKHPLFSNALDKIRHEQMQRLLDKGLSGDYNPVIAKLILSSNHGFREKSDMTSGDAPIQSVVYLPTKPKKG
jgi:hypothetical protein